MDNEEIQGVKFSEFPSQTPVNTDEVVGLHSGDNARFSIANIVAAVRQGLASIFVPLARTINGKALNNDISLNASDVGAVDTADVGVADGVASLDSTGKVPSSQLPPISSDAEDITYDPTTSGLTATDVQAAIDEVVDDVDGKQSTITASGILKGDGAGGVSAATAGTDYQAPLTIDATPTANSTNPVQSGGVYTDVRTRVPVYGMGDNLLDNAYFVGGGSQLGDGVFPINQRGQTSYTLSSRVYTVDRWRAYKYGGNATITLKADCMEISGENTAFSQKVKVEVSDLLGKTVTLSIIVDGTLYSQTETMPTTFNQTSGIINISATGFNVALVSRPAPAGWTNAYYVSIGTLSTTVKRVTAVKLEFGSEQTLAHQENGVWVLNEIPDFGEELRKCQRKYFDTGATSSNGIVTTGFANAAGTIINVFIPTPVSMEGAYKSMSATVGWVRGDGADYGGVSTSDQYIRILKNGIDGISVLANNLSGKKYYAVYFTQLIISTEE